MKTKDCLKLFTSFFKIGLFTFGGGYAMLPMIQREITEKHGWATEEEVFGGEIEFETTFGEGTTFVVRLNPKGLKGDHKNELLYT